MDAEVHIKLALSADFVLTSCCQLNVSYREFMSRKLPTQMSDVDVVDVTELPVRSRHQLVDL